MREYNDETPALDLTVWCLFRKGHDTIEIGRRVGCSEAVAAMHLSRAFDRLHVMRNRDPGMSQADFDAIPDAKQPTTFERLKG